MVFMSLFSTSIAADCERNTHEAVISSSGKLARDKYGCCVRTAFDAGKDPCRSYRTIDVDTVFEEMDERIVYFDFDSAVLKEEQKRALERLANTLREYKVTDVKIIGYTDRIGKDEYNKNLSMRRANSVKGYLDSLIKLDSSIIHLKAFGNTNPIKDCSDVSGRSELIECLAPNRRVEVEVDKYTTSHLQNRVEEDKIED
jgi:outer membrane protein OmpA-like peptidoglycan-associated protein